MAKRKKTDIVPLMVRLRENLRGQIEAAAKAQERSLNSEIVARLEESFLKDRSREEREEMIASNRLTQETLLKIVRGWTQLYQQLSRKIDQRQAADEEFEPLLEHLLTETPREMTDLPTTSSERMPDHDQPERAARSRLLREFPDKTDEWRLARLRSTAEGYRRNAQRHEARGAHDKAAQMRQAADKLERDAAALTRERAQEPELPMPSVTGRGRQSKGGKS